MPIHPVHDRGHVLTDVAVMLTGGGTSIADIRVLRHQSTVLGPVASSPTVWRTLDEVTAGKRKKIQVARARARKHVWSHLPGRVPASKCAGADLGGIDPGSWTRCHFGYAASASGAMAGPAPHKCERVMKINELNNITDDVVETARFTLVISLT